MERSKEGLVVLTLDELKERKGVTWECCVKVKLSVDKPESGVVLKEFRDWLKYRPEEQDPLIIPDDVVIPGYISSFIPVDADGVVFETIFSEERCKRVYYKPTCKYGYKECLCDPAYALAEGERVFEDGFGSLCSRCINANKYYNSRRELCVTN